MSHEWSGSPRFDLRLHQPYLDLANIPRIIIPLCWHHRELSPLTCMIGENANCKSTHSTLSVLDNKRLRKHTYAIFDTSYGEFSMMIH